MTARCRWCGLPPAPDSATEVDEDAVCWREWNQYASCFDVEESVRDAAPDLLAMCEELLPELACHCDEGFTSRDRHEPNTLCHYYDELKAVIAKAKGEPHAR
jgi:hypothetical protein